MVVDEGIGLLGRCRELVDRDKGQGWRVGLGMKERVKEKGSG